MPHEVSHNDRAVILYESAEVDQWAQDEMRELAYSANVEVAGDFFSRVRRRPGQNFISQDRARELFELINEVDANSVIVGSDLQPSEHAELQNEVDVRVVDRTQLILDIFAQRAHTREGKLQVELAQLNYLLPRLTGTGTALSRLGGGVGTRGPGETKLETDRRRLRKRIDSLNDEINAVKKHREVSRSARRKLPFPSAALVGYTSAGKSTMLNLLSGADIPADPKLFSTLDPTTRRVVLPDGWGLLVTDTVGFIRELPHSLVAAFRATLEEVVEADLLIHVVDASHPRRQDMIEAVEETLGELGVAEKPVVMVYNKSDLLTDTYELREIVADDPFSCYISAAKREGIQYLIDKITGAIADLMIHITATIPYDRSDLVSACYDYGHVIKADYQQDGIVIEATVSRIFARNLSPYIAAGREAD